MGAIPVIDKWCDMGKGRVIALDTEERIIT